MRLKSTKILAIAIIIIQVISCNTPSTNEGVLLCYSDSLNVVRKANNKDLKNNKRSPIEQSKREQFVGLNYYSPQESWIIQAHVDWLINQTQEEIATSTGEIRLMTARAVLKFKIDGKTFELTGFSETSKNSNQVFVPFYDATNGTETYSGGRYLNVVIQKNDSVEIDFNLAHNPYCHYNHSFSCPIPPNKNTLSIAVKAGEKIWR